MVTKLALCAAVLFSADASGPGKTPPKGPEVKTSEVKAADKTPAAKPAAKAPDVELLVIEKNVIDRTNEERARRGLPPLEVDVELVKSARAHASWMTLTQNLQHTRLPVGENIAMGQRDSQEAVADWMRSPGHRSNILNRSYRRIGAAAYRTAQGTIYWCQQFRN